MGQERGNMAEKRGLYGIAAALLLALALVILFWNVFPSNMYLSAPDCSVQGLAAEKKELPSSFFGHWCGTWLGIPGGPRSFLPRRLLLCWLPADAYQVWAYIFDILLLFVAGYYWFAGRRLHRAAAPLAALGLALSPATFTLVSAGHLGKFGMLPFAVFMLALLERGCDRRSIYHYALAGVCAGVGMSEHQDIMMMFGLLGAVYVVFRIIWRVSRFGGAGALWRDALGLLVAGLLFVGVSLPTLTDAFRNILPSRQTIVGQDPKDKYIFATNWSLPPEDTLEFAAPLVFGVETGNLRVPYWGRLGRTMDWEKTGKGYRNFRQHTVYLGLFQLFFAGFAVAAAFFLRRRRGADPPNDAPGPPGFGRADVIFWVVAWLGALLFAFGRYTPVYRLFYALPVASSIRAPVKFLHLVEVATAVLCAGGLHAFFTAAFQQETEPSTDQWRPVRAILCTAALSAAFFLGALMVLGNSGGLAAHWKQLGLEAHVEVLFRTMVGALGRAGLGFAICAGIIAATRRFRSSCWLPVAVPLALLILVTADVTTVNRRYIRAVNADVAFRSDHVVARLAREREPFRVACPVSDGLSHHWLKYQFPGRGIETFDFVGVSGLSPEYANFFEAVRSNPLRLWQLTNVRYVAGPASTLRPFVEKGPFEPVVAVAFRRDPRGRGHESVLVPVDRASHLLLLNRLALPRAVLYYRWDTGPEDVALRRIADPAWNPLERVMVTGTVPEGISQLPVEPVAIEEYGRRRITIRVAAKAAAVLLLNDKHDPNWSVTVDGDAAPLLRCNYIMRGVAVPAGSHVIEFAYRSPYRSSCWVRILVLASAFGSVVVAVVWSRLRRSRARSTS